MTRGRTQQAGLEPRDCVICSTRFLPYRDFHVTCGDRKCREQAKTLSPRLIEVDIACKYCGTQFHTISSRIGKLPPCPDCAKKNEAERGKTKRDNRNKRYREMTIEQRQEMIHRNIEKKYGITAEEYQLLLIKQNNRCAICGNKPKSGGVKSAARLHVDHDHTTGVVRGLLCGSCNLGLGSLKDSMKNLHAAIRYLTG